MIMLEYYRVLNNAWKTQLSNSARLAIQMMSDIPRAEKLNQSSLDKLMDTINTRFGG
jgi:acetolactate synthase regulatory subunit